MNFTVDARTCVFYAATTNYAKNPSFEVNVTDDTEFWQSGTGASVNLDASQSYSGRKSCRVRAGDAGSFISGIAGVSVSNGETVTVKGWLRTSANPTGNKAALCIRDLGSSDKATVYATVAANGAWEHLKVSWLNNTGAAATCVLRGRNLFTDSTTDVWFDALQIATVDMPYCDGDQPLCRWADDTLAHNSISRRPQRGGLTVSRR